MVGLFNKEKQPLSATTVHYVGDVVHIEKITYFNDHSISNGDKKAYTYYCTQKWVYSITYNSYRESYNLNGRLYTPHMLGVAERYVYLNLDPDTESFGECELQYEVYNGFERVSTQKKKADWQTYETEWLELL